MTLTAFNFTSANGPMQMATDDVMLANASDGVASFRFYDWREPTLSLGYFQPARDHSAIPTLADLPSLRRASGGAAILHGDGDLTYSLALPAAKNWHDGEPWICRFHHLLQGVFANFSVQSKAVACGEERKLEPVLCFAHHTAGDLLQKNIKFVGSAQRKQKGALLQHGTIRLRSSPRLPQLPGLLDLNEVGFSPSDMMAAVIAALAANLGCVVHHADVNANVDTSRYRSREWNEKR